jgi:hypothetical protein
MQRDGVLWRIGPAEIKQRLPFCGLDQGTSPTLPLLPDTQWMPTMLSWTSGTSQPVRERQGIIEKIFSRNNGTRDRESLKENEMMRMYHILKRTE